jgi:phosphoribosylglycinamide formyltransferase-1
MKQNIVIFASGSGSNALNVCRYFQNHSTISVSAIFCNNPNAGIIEKIKPFQIPLVLFNKSEFNKEEEFIESLNRFKPTVIALLGFLWKMPAYLVHYYPHKIVNLHPALLPKFGGKGMYGHYVHEAVKAANETKTGISIHWVNSQYDEGEIIAQFECEIQKEDSVSNIAEKIHLLEQLHVPSVIENVLKNLSNTE